MNTSDFASKSVGAIVRDDFAAARVFKSFGIDFCCGGTATLADACRMAGVDVESVVAQLASKDEECGVIPFDMWPTDLLIDYVLKIHHRNIRAYGPELLALIEKVAARHGSQHPELHDLVKLFAASLEDLESHLQKEEQVLFPYAYDLFYASERGEHASAMHCGTVANPIRQTRWGVPLPVSRIKGIVACMHRPKASCISVHGALLFYKGVRINAVLSDYEKTQRA